MELEYWLVRKRASMAKAELATTSEARRLHQELVGRYSDMAAAVANQRRRQVNAAAIVWVKAQQYPPSTLSGHKRPKRTLDQAQPSSPDTTQRLKSYQCG